MFNMTGLSGSDSLVLASEVVAGRSFTDFAAEMDVDRLKPLNKAAELIRDEMVCEINDRTTHVGELLAKFKEIAESLQGEPAS